jgi:hypothetical protein
MALQSAGQMSFADVYNEITGESLQNPPISITLAELGQLQNASGQTIPLNQNSPYKPDGVLPTVFPDEWYRYCQTCGVPKPFLQISKAATPNPSAGEFFNFAITVTNNGETSTSGNVYIYDTIPNNIIISSVTGPNQTSTIAGQNVTITYTGGLGVGQSVQFFIIVKTFYSGTFYNQASCNGGGDNTIRYSNTTATSVNTATYTSTKTERRDRTLQRNDCGELGTGSFVQVWSPYFTNTYTSFISQADADAQATNLSVTQANNWLDANSQNVANQMGSCGYVYPTGELILSGESQSTRGLSFFLIITVRINTAYTIGTTTINLPLPNGISYKDVFNVPAGWSLSVSSNMIVISNPSQLEPGYNQGIGIRFNSLAVGNYNLQASMFGGGLVNTVNSNTFNHIIRTPAVYSLTAFAENLDFTYGGNGLDLPVPVGDIYAVPTDRAYYTAVLDITSGETNNDSLDFKAYLPAHYPGSLVRCILNTTYWEYAYSAPAGAIQITPKGSVPIGQYYFRFYIDMTIDYYLADTSSNPSGLRVKDTFQLVDFIQMASFYFSPNNFYITQRYAYIRWAANYAVQLNYQFSRIPNNPNNLNLITRNYRTTNDIIKSFNGLPNTDSNFLTFIYYLDPARGTGEVEASYGGAFYLYYINSGFPNYRNEQYFTIEIKTDLFQNGQEIVQNSGRGGSFTYTVQSLVPNPKLLFGEMLIYVNPDGSYDFGNV